MATANVSDKQSVVQTFQDKAGVSYDIANIQSISRNVGKSSVRLEIEGQIVVVEINPTEAINIIERLN